MERNDTLTLEPVAIEFEADEDDTLPLIHAREDINCADWFSLDFTSFDVETQAEVMENWVPLSGRIVA